MDKMYFNAVAPLVKNMEAWKAFLVLLEHQKSLVLKQLIGKPNAEEALRLSAEYSMLERLSRQQDIIINAEKMDV